MNNLDYRQIQTIQDNTTKKLLNYINEFLEEDNSLDSIEFYYPNFDEQKTKVAFNIWISTDYKTRYNKTFIEHMLEEKSNQLSSLEKEILLERNRSHISLFEITDVEGEHIKLTDLLTKNYHTIWDPNTAKILKVSDLIFCRVGRVLNHESFIGNISFLPPSSKYAFLREIFLDYNYVRLRHQELSIHGYLKQYSVDVYRIYTECIYDALDIEEDTTSIFYDEIEEFESFLQIKTSRSEIKRHITNLINLYEFYFLDQDMTLYDLDQIKLDELIMDSIDRGFVSSQEELSSYISTLKIYLKFLKSQDPIYNEVYDKIMDINRNRFLYTQYFEPLKPIFDLNFNLSGRIANILNEKALRFVMDYERFILYVMNGPLECTDVRKYIKRRDLLKLNEIMENQEPITKKAPNQDDFTMIHLFYQFSLDNKLMRSAYGGLYITKKASQFLRLKDSEKYSLLLQYIWSNQFLSSICKTADMEYIEAVREKILKLLDGLKPNTFYKINTLLPAYVDSPRILSQHNRYLELIGLIELKYEPKLSIKITSLGKAVFKTLLGGDDREGENPGVIDLDKYNRNR